ncbi:hypothetical protein M0L20_14735 [Spirosoma sp. RP8]|uniref:Uncharacterized protein n=1 Tax=Spirosoma liriopis TaxID=2937440 RepID=A0ABT0HLT6_9BACT|nr:hypothetical protein [Spirosoma liriopis]MCK8493123.1 hypothetical protein [Spirosoma liriopis]
MLESIAINRHTHPNLDQPFSIGHLAECLLFYGKVDAVISPTELEEIFRKCDISILISLMASGILNLHIRLSSFGSSQTPGTSRINYGVYSVRGDTLPKRVVNTLLKVYNDGYKCQKYAERILPYLYEFDDEYDLVDGFLGDSRFTTNAFREVVKQIFPDYPIPLDLKFNLHKVEKRDIPNELVAKATFETDTNFDLDQFEADLRARRVEGHQDFTVTFMMKAAAAIQDIDVASEFQSELSTEEANNIIVQKAILNLDEYQPNNEKVITEFNQHIIQDCPSIADTINSGLRSFDEYMYLFEKSHKFRDWIRNAHDNEDHSLIRNYINEIEAESFTDGKFYKLLKFIVVSAPLALRPFSIPGASELVTNAANLVTGTAFDVFTDKIATRFNKWKPNQFVNNDLREFLKE